MDPAEVLAALNDIEAHGWRLGAIVHSHPASPPTPSATDLREAFYPEALLVIVGLAASPPSARVWRIIPRDGVGSTVVEVPLIVDGEA
jgi:proteasome lid subunit RPN8/RPN11